MSDATLRIKNLSIALEALSRINNEGSPDLYDRVEDLLKDQIKEIETATPPARPATTTFDDDIPF